MPALRRAFLALAALALIPACGNHHHGRGGGGGGGGGGNEPPNVSITSPSSGAQFVAPATVDIEANASDPDGTVTQVDFFEGVTQIGTSTSPPFKVTWSGVPEGTFSLHAVATDNSGASTSSNPVAITVAPAEGGGSYNQAPTVDLIHPSPGDDFPAPATIALEAQAADSDGAIVRVEFFAGGASLGSVSQPPFVLTWANVPAGSYSLTAAATDTSGATTVSVPVNITVSEVTTSGWQMLSSGTPADLMGVFFANSTLGWVVGQQGIVLRTVTGGRGS